jgi:predicted aminopeptidase
VRRWLFVGGTGVACGALLGWLFWSLTGGTVAAVVMGVAMAAILVVLAFAGANYNSTYKQTMDKRAEAIAKRERVRKAIEDTHRRK